MAATATNAEIERFRLLVGDVVITKDSETWKDIGVPALVTESDDDFVCGYHLAMLRPDPKMVSGRYLFRCLQSKTISLQLELSAKGVTRYGLPQDGIARLQLPIPPSQEQHLIADFLDRQTQEIDNLISEKHRMLNLLDEKKAALITHVVTKGVRPKPELRRSDVGWLKEIPKHWDVRRCATLFRQLDERGEPDLPLLLVSLNTGVTLREFSDDKIERVMSDFSEYKIARKGQLAFNKMRFWQGAGGIAPADGLVSPDYTVAEIMDDLEPDFVELLVGIPAFNNEVRRYSHGIVDDRLRLYWDEFKVIQVPVPPIPEQREIVEFVKNTERMTADVSDALTNSIELLSERRRAIITSAITGEIPIEDMST